jgi:Ca-activated chloride channel family protein
MDLDRLFTDFVPPHWEARWHALLAGIPHPFFLWPDLLWLLLLVPALLALYLVLQRRRRPVAVHYSSLALVRAAGARGAGWRRHVPPLLLLLALTVLLLASARPVAVIALPAEQQTIMLAIDVSASMRATDVKPNRLVAAQQAAKMFIRDLPRSVRVGIVAFAGSAQVVQQPTQSHEELDRAIDAFQLQRGTATGNGIVLALATLFPGSGASLENLAQGDRLQSLSGSDGAVLLPPPRPVPVGSYRSAAIVMLTDGQRTSGVDPLDAARMAAERGVRIYTVGVGTRDGATIGFDGWSMRVRLDEETLKEVAARTGGEYFFAGTAPDLNKVYSALSSRLAVEKRETEITALFALVAAALTLLSVALSMWWLGRLA